MMKKLITLLVIGGLVGIFFLPEISIFVARKSFAPENVNKEWAPKLAYKAGRINMRLWRYKAGGAILQKTLNTWPKYEKQGDMHFQIGLCYEKTEQPNKAVEWYNAFIKKYPGHRWLDQAKRRIVNIQANQL